MRGKALVVISLPLVVLLLSLVLIYNTERQTARAEEDVRRVLLVQGDIQTVHTLLAEAAASVRGYLLTHREDFLPGYLKAKPLIQSALRRLDSNVRDERVRAQLTAITPLINSKIDGLEQMLSDSEAKSESITTILINNKYILDGLREHISTMLTLEDTLLAERTARHTRPASGCCSHLAGRPLRTIRCHRGGAVFVQRDRGQGAASPGQCPTPGSRAAVAAATARER